MWWGCMIDLTEQNIMFTLNEKMPYQWLWIWDGPSKTLRSEKVGVTERNKIETLVAVTFNNMSVVLLSRLHPCVQSGAVSGWLYQPWAECEQPALLHNLWPTGRFRAFRHQHEERYYHVVQQEFAPVCACANRPPSYWGKKCTEKCLINSCNLHSSAAGLHFRNQVMLS